MKDSAEKRGLELAGGRSVTVSSGDGGETVEFRADGGEVELRIKMTAEGPVVQLTGARVEINAAESIAMQCKEFTVKASEKMALGSEGTIDLESAEDMVLRGKLIHLN